MDKPLLRVVTDIVIAKIIDKKLHILLTQRSTTPHKGKWCLPWWFMQLQETAEQTAMRILKKETGITQAYLEQFHVFSWITRDPRRRAIGIWFIWILTTNQEVLPGDTQEKSMFIPIKQLPYLVFDHKEVVEMAYQRLIAWVENWTLIKYFLPKIFTLSQLQQIYETVLQRDYEKRNFRRIIKKDRHIKPSKSKEKNVAHRPANLYRYN